MQHTTHNNVPVCLWPTFKSPVQHRVNDRINVLVYVTKQEGKAKLDGNLEVLQKVRVIKGADLE